jgi:hypothetical protein
VESGRGDAGAALEVVERDLRARVMECRPPGVLSARAEEDLCEIHANSAGG